MNKQSALLAIIILMLCIGWSCRNSTQSKTVQTTVGKIQKVAYHSDRDGNAEIYSIHADGTNETRLTENDADDRFPSWSPDGSKILFQSDRDGKSAIYMMKTDGSYRRTALSALEAANKAVRRYGYFQRRTR